MTHRHAQRRGVVPRPSAKDLRCWRRLIARAARLDDGATTTADAAFVEAAGKARKAILPLGHQRGDSPFMGLIRGAELLAEADRPSTRGELVERLRRMASACAAVLDAQAAGPRERRDIDG